MKHFQLCITCDLGFEFWAPVPNYEGIYCASTYGRIKNVKTGHIRKPVPDKDGYETMLFSKKGVIKNEKIGRIIGLTFIPKMSDKQTDINHKDENKTNNRVENLEWCTHRQNCMYGTRNIRSGEKQSIPIVQYDLDGNYIREWKSSHLAEREGNFIRSNIKKCLDGIYKQSGGFIWKYKK